MMRGTIKYVAEDERFGFRGAISGEDGWTYRFKSFSWANRSLSLENLCEGQSVEFEQSAPKQDGYVYPQCIRFPGETFDAALKRVYFSVAHSHSRFNDFAYIQKDTVRLV